MIINQLSKYFFDENRILYSSNNLIINDPNKKLSNNNSKITDDKSANTIYIPKEKDTLFWILFIIKNGEFEYEMSLKNNFLNEKNIKIDYVSKIRASKELIKQYKIISLSELENNLSNDAKLSIESFFILSALENKNIIFIWKNSYFKLYSNDENDLYIISNRNNKYGFQKANKTYFMESIKNNKFELNTLAKPIKSISSYKVDEIKSILTKLGVPLENKLNKNNLYEKLILYFSNYKKN